MPLSRFGKDNIDGGSGPDNTSAAAPGPARAGLEGLHGRAFPGRVFRGKAACAYTESAFLARGVRGLCLWKLPAKAQKGLRCPKLVQIGGKGPSGPAAAFIPVTLLSGYCYNLPRGSEGQLRENWPRRRVLEPSKRPLRGLVMRRSRLLKCGFGKVYMVGDEGYDGRGDGRLLRGNRRSERRRRTEDG